MEQYGCTQEQMEQVLEHTLTIVFLPSARYLDPSLTTDTKTNLVRIKAFHVCTDTLYPHSNILLLVDM